jgi:MFS family permease
MFMLCGMLITSYLIPYGAYKGIRNIGLYFTVNAVLMVISRPLAGHLTDKYGPGITIWPGMALYMCAFLLLSIASDIRLVIAAAACASIGGGIVSPAAQSMTMQSVRVKNRAVASNTLYTVMDLGNFLGPTLGGLILARSNYETMYRCALIPLSLALIVFSLGWKSYLRHRSDALAADRLSE